jgi:hypothetical protein
LYFLGVFGKTCGQLKAEVVQSTQSKPSLKPAEDFEKDFVKTQLETIQKFLQYGVR